VKSHTEYRTFKTRERQEIVHITPWVEEELAKSGIKEGLCLISAMHITASVFVNDNESGLHEDIMDWLEGHIARLAVTITCTIGPGKTTAPHTSAA
jgi:thiamine phosphate synthase YjbQ (UPF0047 family)